MNRFTVEEMENCFEIGRIIEAAQRSGTFPALEDYDSKGLFGFALELAIKFEEVCPDTEDYYADIDEFVNDEIAKRFEKEE